MNHSFPLQQNRAMTGTRRWAVARDGLIALGALLSTACSQSVTGTETENPADDGVLRRPPYESPVRFGPAAPGIPGCPPSDDDTGPARGPGWARAGNRLIGASHNETLWVVDGAETGAPALASATPLKGQASWVLAAGDEVALVVEERPEVPGDTLPQPSALETTRRLVHFDASDSTAPVRLGAVDIEGEFWRLVERGDRVWVMSAKLEADADSCALSRYSCGSPERQALLLRGYDWSSDGWQPAQQLELSMQQRAWAAQDGFVSYMAELDDNGEPSQGELHLARFDQDTLVEGHVAIDFVPKRSAPVGLVGELLYVFSESPAADGSILHIYDLSQKPAVWLGDVEPLPWRIQDGVVFGDHELYVGSEAFTQAALHIDLTDPSAPVVAPVPGGASMVLRLPAAELASASAGASSPRLLGWGDPTDSGQLSLSLIGPEGVEEQVSTNLPIPTTLDDSAPLYPDSTWVEAGRALYTQRAFDAETNSPIHQLAAVDARDGLELLGPVPVGYTQGAFLFGDWGVAPSPSGVASWELASGELGYLDFGIARANAWDTIAVGEWDMSLVRHGSEALKVVTWGSDGTPEGELEVSPGSRQLLTVGDQLLVLATESRTQCEQTGLDCSDYVPHVAVIEPGPEPELVATVPLPEPPFSSAGELTTVTMEWYWVLHLEERLVLGAAFEATCMLQDECEALGIEPSPLSETNVAFAEPAPCPPDATSCEPAELPPEPEVYGALRQQRFYWLDLGASGGGRFVELGASTLESPADSRFAEPRAQGRELLATRLEGSTSAATARFMLDRLSLGSDGEVAAHAPLNVPGYPLAVRDGGSMLFCAEPTDEANESHPTGPVAVLHRLRLDDSGALVEASRELDGRYGDVRVIGDRALYLRQGLDGCDDSGISSIDLGGDLEVLGTFTLPGAEWTVVDQTDTHLLLGGPNGRGFAVLDLTGATAELAAYAAGRFPSEMSRDYGVFMSQAEF